LNLGKEIAMGSASRVMSTLAGCGLLLTTFLPGMSVAAEPAPSSSSAAGIRHFPVLDPPPGMNLPFSAAVRVGDLVYLSGELGTRKGRLVPGGIEAETRQLMDNIAATLARTGSSFDHVVQCTVALADIAEWPAFNAIYRTYFREKFPARMAYASGGLALGARVEVQCNAVVVR
jgi:2-iminobutanoate/2-iminopropanoate deaminase